MTDLSPTLPVPSLGAWEYLFYDGDRLLAEVVLIAAFFNKEVSSEDLVSGTSLLRSSHGGVVSENPVNSFAKYQAFQPEPKNSYEALKQFLLVADMPDALLFWVLHRKLPSSGGDYSSQLLLIQRLLILLSRYKPNRPDLLYQVLEFERTGSLYRSAPRQLFRPGEWYTRPGGFAQQLQVGWSQGRYEAMWLGALRAQVDGRWFPLTDHHVRGLTIIGEVERAFFLFQQLYNNRPSDFQLGSISNMLFFAMGCEHIHFPLVKALVAHFDYLASQQLSSLPVAPSSSVKYTLSVDEKPLLVVASSDLRQHPVGRFWLPIARKLRSIFKVVSVVGQPRDRDPIRDELRQLSDEWWPLEISGVEAMAERIKDCSPHLLIDLGGHTADNYPVLLSRRLAAVQATYLGFYGPTYAQCCDWWIVDHVLESHLINSYPGAEKLWALPGPSLCYVPSLHGLPELKEIHYREPNSLVFGSFNHTRKLTRASQARFGRILHDNPDAVLQFRSHSFHDPEVRRHFLIRLQDMGIKPHQLQPLPYAPSASAAMADYGRIHLHLDTFPVSGTTTTLDSLAMGIPVLTSPTPYYAGTISASILEHAGLADHVCADPSDLPSHARWLAERYRTADARRALAELVRKSPICDDHAMPSMFIQQLQLMLRRALVS